AITRYRPQENANESPLPTDISAVHHLPNLDEEYGKVLQTDIKLSRVSNSDIVIRRLVVKMLRDPRDDMIVLQRLHRHTLNKYMQPENPGNEGGDFPNLHPDIFKVIPVSADNYSSMLRHQLADNVIDVILKYIINVDYGYLGTIKYETMEEGGLFTATDGKKQGISDLMRQYLEIINHIDLRPFLESTHDNFLSQFWKEVIAQNDEFRARYYFNDIVALQVIPKIAIAYIKRNHWRQAISFIDEMLLNPDLSRFLNTISVDTDVNYYEQMAYAAAATNKSFATDLLNEVKYKPGFNIKRLYRCAPDGVHSKLKNILKTSREIVARPLSLGKLKSMSEADCLRFRAQLERVAIIDIDILVITER
ncbi:hypothetical protein H4R34_004072, partial [Dimargaris verticillata]